MLSVTTHFLVSIIKQSKAFTSIASTQNVDSLLVVPAGQHNAVWQSVSQAEKRVRFVEESHSHNLPPVFSKVAAGTPNHNTIK